MLNFLNGRRVSANNIYEISSNNEFQKRSVGEQQPAPHRRHSTVNQRTSLAHIFFGITSPLDHQNYGASEKDSSQLSFGGEGRKCSRDASFYRKVHFADIPIDSRQKHEFHSDNEAESDPEPCFFISNPSEISSRRNSKFGRFPTFASPLPSSSISFSTVFPTSNAHSVTSSGAGPTTMRKLMRVVVVGAKKVGKTAILQQLAQFADANALPYVPTIDDTYQIQTHVDADDRPKEVIIFHDTAGVMEFGPLELKRPYIQVADAFILVYSVLDLESFNRMDLLKKFIERQFGKEKKEVPIVVVGTMIDLPGRLVDREFAVHWASREKVKLFEVSARDRASILDVVHYLSGRFFNPFKETKFSISKRLKPEKSNAQIVMDF